MSQQWWTCQVHYLQCRAEDDCPLCAERRAAMAADPVAAYPTAAWPWRLPVIRHARALFAMRHIPINPDQEDQVRHAIWEGRK